MKDFEKLLEELLIEVEVTLIDAIKEKGHKSPYSSSKCLKIQNDELMFNLESSRYLIAIDSDLNLIDDCGYQYSLLVLDTENLMQVANHLIRAPKLLIVNDDEDGTVVYRVQETPNDENGFEFTFFINDNSKKLTICLGEYENEEIISLLKENYTDEEIYIKEDGLFYNYADEEVLNVKLAEYLYFLEK